MNLNLVIQKTNQIQSEVNKLIIGMEDIIEFMLIGLYANGHVILEGVPGIAKTLLTKSIARTCDINYGRIQFTPDLMPTDVIGTNVFNMKNAEFVFHHGPIFANLVLIDEINRAPAKTQAALFEVMEERQITVDGTRYNMEFPFFVIATQNPIDQEGTYKLPEAQLDRFLFKLNLTYPNLENEIKILNRYSQNYLTSDLDTIIPCLTKSELLDIQHTVESVFIKEEIIKYIADISYSTRNHPYLFLGASPRASLSMLKAAKCVAAMAERDFVIPEDIQRVAYPVLNHRIVLSAEKEIEGLETKDIINEIIHSVEVPR